MTPDDTSSATIESLRRFHGHFVSPRRVRVLSALLSPLIPSGASVLDIGCGDGAIAALIRRTRSDLSITGVDLSLRPGCEIDAVVYDGKRLPFPDASRDICLFVDVLHHATDMANLLQDACRVARRGVLVKDHLCHTRADRAILTAMDWFGNSTYGFDFPRHYLAADGWRRLFASCGVTATARHDHLRLYPFPFSLVFGRNLHFIAMLESQA